MSEDPSQYDLDPSHYDPIYQPGVAFLRDTAPESEERMGVSLAGTAPDAKHRKRKSVVKFVRRVVVPLAGLLVYLILIGAALYLALGSMNGAK